MSETFSLGEHVTVSASEMPGGPAFPTTIPGFQYHGMSLRDWFAGQALAGLLAVPAFAEGPYADDMRAMRCYEYADAMLKARQS